MGVDQEAALDARGQDPLVARPDVQVAPDVLDRDRGMLSGDRGRADVGEEDLLVGGLDQDGSLDAAGVDIVMRTPDIRLLPGVLDPDLGVARLNPQVARDRDGPDVAVAVGDPAFAPDLLRHEVLVTRLQRAGPLDVRGIKLAVPVADRGLLDPLDADDAISVVDADGHRPGDGQDEASFEVLLAELVPVGGERQLVRGRRQRVLEPAGDVLGLILRPAPDDLLKRQLNRVLVSAAHFHPAVAVHDLEEGGKGSLDRARLLGGVLFAESGESGEIVAPVEVEVPMPRLDLVDDEAGQDQDDNEEDFPKFHGLCPGPASRSARSFPSARERACWRPRRSG